MTETHCLTCPIIDDRRNHLPRPIAQHQRLKPIDHKVSVQKGDATIHRSKPHLHPLNPLDEFGVDFSQNAPTSGDPIFESGEDGAYLGLRVGSAAVAVDEDGDDEGAGVEGECVWDWWPVCKEGGCAVAGGERVVERRGEDRWSGRG